MPRPGQKLHVFPLGDEAVVDSTTRGSVARLAVHSCRCSTGHTTVHEARHLHELWHTAVHKAWY